MSAPRAARRAAAALWLLSSVAGCTELASYDGQWQGTVVGDTMPVFILRGFPVGTGLVLEDFQAPPVEGPPGYLTTIDYDAFAHTPLEVIAPLEHDELSRYELPGSGRLKSYIFAARPTAGPIAGRDAMVFMSLMEGDKIEMRIVVGNGDESTGGHFGLFRLEPVP